MANGTKTESEGVSEEKEYKKDKEKNKEEKVKKDKEADEDSTFFRPNKKDEDETTTTDTKPRTKDGAAKNETTAVKGYGEPTKGSYNSAEKGYHTFGTEGQGDNTEGAMDEGSKNEADRGIYVTVTAVADQGSDTILLEVGNYDFLEEYVWEEEAYARVVKATFAAFALVSFTMI